MKTSKMKAPLSILLSLGFASATFCASAADAQNKHESGVTLIAVNKVKSDSPDVKKEKRSHDRKADRHERRDRDDAEHERPEHPEKVERQERPEHPERMERSGPDRS
jgi:hypothetical protein